MNRDTQMRWCALAKTDPFVSVNGTVRRPEFGLLGDFGSGTGVAESRNAIACLRSQQVFTGLAPYFISWIICHIFRHTLTKRSNMSF